MALLGADLSYQHYGFFRSYLQLIKYHFIIVGHPEQGGWAPSEIKELTPGPMGPPNLGPAMMGQVLGPPHMGAPPHMLAAPPYVPPYRQHPPPHMHDRDRDRERDRDRDRERDRDRMREREERERGHRDRREEVSVTSAMFKT